MRSVYVIKASHDLYKIGIASNVKSRLKSHQTSNGSTLTLVTYAQCGNALKLEAQTHAMLKEYVQPGGREWFKLTPEQAIKVCIYIHQQAEQYHSEDDIRQLLDEYAAHHKSISNAQKDLADLSEQMGSNIQKAIGRLQRYKPLPKILKAKPKPQVNADNVLYERAVELVREAEKASTSMLQMKLKIGYGRAARLIQELESNGIVGPADGSRPRDVFQE